MKTHFEEDVRFACDCDIAFAIWESARESDARGHRRHGHGRVRLAVPAIREEQILVLSGSDLARRVCWM
jgi:hypothetical protein